MQWIKQYWFPKYGKCSIKIPRELFLSQTHLRGFGVRGSIDSGGLFNSPKTMITTRIQSRKAQVQEVGGHAAKDKKQIRTSGW